VSHQPERKEKDCLNCGTNVEGRFCHVCGQENIIIKQSMFSLATHFIYDVFHFDGKFFDTLKKLALKPGFVAKQYISGKRVAYLDPIRMYLFTSAIFFLIFFSLSKFNFTEAADWGGMLSGEERMKVLYDLKAQVKTGKETLPFHEHAIALLSDSSYLISISPTDSLAQDSLIIFSGKTYKLKTAQYTTELTANTEAKSKNFINRGFARMNEKFKKDPKQSITQLLETFLHRLPYMLFLLLPFFAIILKMLYLRNKKYYYSDHFIFTLYHFIFSFILLLIVVGVAALQNWSGWDFFGWIAGFLVLFWMYYLYKGMKIFYEQSRGKTIVKFILLNLLASVVLLILFLIFLLITAFQI
jgi:hypothetical protein